MPGDPVEVCGGKGARWNATVDVGVEGVPVSDRWFAQMRFWDTACICLLGRWSVWFLFVCSFAVFFWLWLWLGTHVTSRWHKSVWVHETWQFCATPTYTRLAWYRQSEKVGRCRSRFVCNLFYFLSTLSYLSICTLLFDPPLPFPSQ